MNLGSQEPKYTFNQQRLQSGGFPSASVCSHITSVSAPNTYPSSWVDHMLYPSTRQLLVQYNCTEQQTGKNCVSPIHCWHLKPDCPKWSQHDHSFSHHKSSVLPALRLRRLPPAIKHGNDEKKQNKTKHQCQDPLLKDDLTFLCPSTNGLNSCLIMSYKWTD